MEGRTTTIICTRTNAPKYILESHRLHFGSICDQNGRNFEPCVGPGEVLCDVYTQELGAAHSLHGHTIDGQRSMQRVHSPEVNDNLLRLLHIQREIVVTAPPGQAAHLASVVCLISVADETHHSRVIRKFNEEVGVV